MIISKIQVLKTIMNSSLLPTIFDNVYFEFCKQPNGIGCANLIWAIEKKKRTICNKMSVNAKKMQSDKSAIG